MRSVSAALVVERAEEPVHVWVAHGGFLGLVHAHRIAHNVALHEAQLWIHSGRKYGTGSASSRYPFLGWMEPRRGYLARFLLDLFEHAVVRRVQARERRAELAGIQMDPLARSARSLVPTNNDAARARSCMRVHYTNAERHCRRPLFARGRTRSKPLVNCVVRKAARLPGLFVLLLLCQGDRRIIDIVKTDEPRSRAWKLHAARLLVYPIACLSATR
jgi:hypothetical protein